MKFEANRPVKTSQKTFEIIEHLSRIDRVRISEIADQLDISKGIVHNHVSTLRELGYVRKIGEEYQLTPKLFSIGFQSRSNSRLFNAAHVPLTDAADSLDTGLILSEQAVTDSIVIDAQQLPDGIDLTIGTTLPFENSLTGLVVASIESQKLPDNTPPVYDPVEIKKMISEQGYALGPIMPSISTRSIVVPIVDDEDFCHGCVAVLFPIDISDQQREQIIEATVQLRIRIENRLDSGWRSTRSFATEKHSWISLGGK
jgi:DNA-binding IclR family transcriptional regulator